MLMMYLVCSADSFEIGIVGIPENFKTLVNKNIMYQEVRKSVGSDPNADPKQCIIPILHSNK